MLNIQKTLNFGALYLEKYEVKCFENSQIHSGLRRTDLPKSWGHA